MYYKKTLPVIILASIFITACAGNNIKQKTIAKTESTKSEEIVLSDFPEAVGKNIPELPSSNDEIKPGNIELVDSAQPKIKIVNFKFDNFDIAEKNKALIKKHAKFLIKNPSYVLSVNGHSDYRGPEIYNEKLSLRRANSVASLLMSYGVPESQLIINSFGASQPVENYDNWYQNRRVEFNYTELYVVSK